MPLVQILEVRHERHVLAEIAQPGAEVRLAARDQFVAARAGVRRG